MKDSFEISHYFKISVQSVFKAWLDSKQHTAMTGGNAIVSPIEGGDFVAWDGYISGTNEEIIENSKIIQKWRTTEFAEKDSSSLLELLFEEENGGCKLTLKQSEIPSGQGEAYKSGWIEHYFEPMEFYFES